MKIIDSASMWAKEEGLFSNLRSKGRVVVAFSGGTDSAYLAWAAHRVLGENALAVTAASPSLPRSHMRAAEEFVRRFGISHEYIETREFDNPAYARNGPDRCFHCKNELFARLWALASQRGYACIAYGTNVDDLSDYRPGQEAAMQHRISSPLLDAGLSKAEIRELSREAGLPTWDRPASACLSSRIPYGTPVTIETIKTVENGEEALRTLGFKQFRVRFHGEVARIEIAREEMPDAFSMQTAAQITSAFRCLGFKYVALDLEGYRQGSLNSTLHEPATARNGVGSKKRAVRSTLPRRRMSSTGQFNRFP